MNVRTFLTITSLALMGWMAASYFSAVPLDDYTAESEQTPEIPFAKSEKVVAELK